MAERKSVSMQDLADKLGISKVTVSKALNGKDGVGEELKEKIFALARESGYVLPDYGKRKSKKVGIIMSPRFSSGDEGKFYMAMYERIIYELQRASCSSIMISPTTATLPSDMNTIQTRGLFDGLIFLGILDKGVREQIAQIDLPKVYVDIYDQTHKSDSVITENIYSSYELTNYLIQQGHTDIGFVGTVGSTTSISDRYLGYLRRMLAYFPSFQVIIFYLSIAPMVEKRESSHFLELMPHLWMEATVKHLLHLTMGNVLAMCFVPTENPLSAH